jgi:hypothetical protein
MVLQTVVINFVKRGCEVEVLMLDRFSACICGWVRQRSFGCPGALSGVRRAMNARFFEFRCSFQFRFYRLVLHKQSTTENHFCTSHSSLTDNALAIFSEKRLQ